MCGGSEENIESLSVPLHFFQPLKLYDTGYILCCEDRCAFIDVVLVELFVLEEIFGNKKLWSGIMVLLPGELPTSKTRRDSDSLKSSKSNFVEFTQQKCSQMGKKTGIKLFVALLLAIKKWRNPPSISIDK